MTTPATRDLLITLARLGHNFLTAFRELARVGPLVPGPHVKRARIQVLSVHAEYLVPLELAYDRGYPSAKAKLCGTWQKCLDGGACTTARDDAPEQKVVCPAGFWGLAHHIERRLWDEKVAIEIQDNRGDVAITNEPGRNRPSLGPLKNVLFGAAEKAADFDTKAFKKTTGAIATALKKAGIKMTRADEWTAWTKLVQSEAPEVLLLLPHTGEELGDATIEIGTVGLGFGAINATHVCLPPPKPPKPGPIVLLLGCRTGTEEIKFSNFVGAFRRANASVVIATLSTVRGRHMAPVAQHAMAVLLEKSAVKKRTMGEVVVALRRRVLAKGHPVGLTLIAYGDIDWQL